MERNAYSQIEHRLGRRYIKSFASGIAHMFSCSAEHYAWLAHRYQKREVKVDLFSIQIEPAEFDIERNRILAGMCRRKLRDSIEGLAPPGSVVSAVLTANFGIDDVTFDGRAAYIGESIFTVILTDDRGREWRVERKEKNMLINN